MIASALSSSRSQWRFARRRSRPRTSESPPYEHPKPLFGADLARTFLSTPFDMLYLAESLTVNQFPTRSGLRCVGFCVLFEVFEKVTA